MEFFSKDTDETQHKMEPVFPRLVFLVPRTDDRPKSFSDANISSDFENNLSDYFESLAYEFGYPDTIITSPHVAQKEVTAKYIQYVTEKKLPIPQVHEDALIRHRYDQDVEEQYVNSQTKNSYNELAQNNFFKDPRFEFFKPKFSWESYTNAKTRIELFCDILLRVNDFKRLKEAGAKEYEGRNIWILTHSFVTFIASPYLFKFKEEKYYTDCSRDCLGFIVDYNLQPEHIYGEIMMFAQKKQFSPNNHQKNYHHHQKNHYKNNQRRNDQNNNRNRHDEEEEPRSYNKRGKRGSRK